MRGRSRKVRWMSGVCVCMWRAGDYNERVLWWCRIGTCNSSGCSGCSGGGGGGMWSLMWYGGGR